MVKNYHFNLQAEKVQYGVLQNECQNKTFWRIRHIENVRWNMYCIHEDNHVTIGKFKTHTKRRKPKRPKTKSRNTKHQKTKLKDRTSNATTSTFKKCIFSGLFWGKYLIKFGHLSHGFVAAGSCLIHKIKIKKTKNLRKLLNCQICP
jgi:hypothetical protein